MSDQQVVKNEQVEPNASGKSSDVAAPRGETMSRRPNSNNNTAFDPQMSDVEVSESQLARACEILCLPLLFLPSFWIQKPREESIVLHFGKVTAKVREPGCHYHSLMGREIRTIPTVQFCASIPRQKVTDSTGNPINISAVITYRFVDPTQALLNVQSPHEYVVTQAMSVLKSVVSNFSYEELKAETEKINIQMLRKLQPRVSLAGAIVLSCMLDELNYAPEIASHMLKQQMARALIDARHLLVKGSVSISTDAVNELSRVGIVVSEEDRARLISSIILITAGDSHAQPVLQI